MTREEHIENLKAIASDMPSDKCADWIESLMAGVKALEQVSSSENANKWIPCSERLPEIHNSCQLYLVTYKQGQICTAFYSETNGRSWWSIDGVEAWMPLPTPYQSEIPIVAEGRVDKDGGEENTDSN